MCSNGKPTQQDADCLREKAAEIERQAALVSDEDGGLELAQRARSMRKQAQEIEKCLPLE